MKSYRNRRLDKERYFIDFHQGRGTYNDTIFEVKKQINNGALIDTKCFKLINNSRVEVDNNECINKIHSFKNYVCDKCNLFFSIDLYSSSGDVYNHHHMRLNPFTKNLNQLKELIN